MTLPDDLPPEPCCFVGEPDYPEEFHMPKLPKIRRRKQMLPKHKTEPALARGVGTAVLGVLAWLGFDKATDVDSVVATAIGIVVLAIGQAIWTRYAVTSKDQVITQVTPDGKVVAGEAAVIPTGTELPVATGHRRLRFEAAVPVNPALLAPHAD